MISFTLKQILAVHERAIQKYGGSSGIRDTGMLQSAIYRPFATFDGQDLYPDIYLKAGALIQSIVKNHPFIDGNKRTAFITTYNFLALNGIKITTGKREIVKFMVSVANKNLSVDEISSWLKSHSTTIV
ncbi:MAG: type II toxin-antitoxin system death-on-curing family toxin [Patescibacteria group bacterium]